MPSANGVYWLVSVPAEGRVTPFDALSQALRNDADVLRFPVPELRVGTLDALMSLSDELVKYDSYVENVTKKIANQLLSLCDNEQQAQGALLVNGANIDGYLKYFKWEEAKYPIRSSLKEITEQITQQVGRLDEELKAKSSQYIQITNSVSAEERKASGNLLTRDLSDIVKPEHIVESEYLTTLFVAVPKSLSKDWEKTYETITDFVLPRSSRVIHEDNEYFLYNVTLFKKVADDYKNLSRDRKFTVREFKFNNDQLQSGKENKRKLAEEKDKIKTRLVLWSKTNFQEAFTAWAHIKAIRVFVESILRYGLPPNFHPVLILTKRRDDKKVRDMLCQMYKHLGSQYATDAHDAETPLEGEAFYPYVSLTINTEFRL